jgi:hypothetical protein
MPAGTTIPALASVELLEPVLRNTSRRARQIGPGRDQARSAYLARSHVIASHRVASNYSARIGVVPRQLSTFGLRDRRLSATATGTHLRASQSVPWDCWLYRLERGSLAWRPVGWLHDTVTEGL